MTFACLVPRTTGALLSRNDQGPGQEVLYVLGRGRDGSNKAGGNVLKSYDFGKNKWRIVDKKMGPEDLDQTESCNGSGWCEENPMQFPRSNFAIAASSETMYALGGNSERPAINLSVESYQVHAVCRSWQLDDVAMKSPRRKPKAAVVDDQLYILGGDDRNTVAVKDLRAVTSQPWVLVSLLRFESWDFDVVAFERRLYVAATIMFENVHRTIFEVFDTEIYEWTDLPPPTGKPIHSISAVIEKEYSRL